MNHKNLDKIAGIAIALAAMLTAAPASAALGHTKQDSLKNITTAGPVYHIIAQPLVDLGQIEQSASIARLATAGFHSNSSWDARPIGYRPSRPRSLALQERILNVPKLRNEAIGDLGTIAGERAKALVTGFKDTSPDVFASILTGGAAIIGTYGYLNGSKGLEEYGVKLGLEKHYLQEQLFVKFRPTWGARFETLGFKSSIGFERPVGEIGKLKSELSFTHRGLRKLSLSYRMNGKDSRVFLNATGNYDFLTEKSSAGISIQYQPATKIHLTFSGNFDNHGDTRFGLGLTCRF